MKYGSADYHKLCKIETYLTNAYLEAVNIECTCNEEYCNRCCLKDNLKSNRDWVKNIIFDERWEEVQKEIEEIIKICEED